MNKASVLWILLLFTIPLKAQTATISGHLNSNDNPVAFANIGLLNTNKGTVSNSLGEFKIKDVAPGTYILRASYVGYESYETEIIVKSGEDLKLTINLKKNI